MRVTPTEGSSHKSCGWTTAVSYWASSEVGIKWNKISQKRFFNMSPPYLCVKWKADENDGRRGGIGDLQGQFVAVEIFHGGQWWSSPLLGQSVGLVKERQRRGDGHEEVAVRAVDEWMTDKCMGPSKEPIMVIAVHTIDHIYVLNKCIDLIWLVAVSKL